MEISAIISNTTIHFDMYNLLGHILYIFGYTFLLGMYISFGYIYISPYIFIWGYIVYLGMSSLFGCVQFTFGTYSVY